MVIKNITMKTAILLNEDFLEMRLGLNSTLAYILGAVDLGDEVYLVDVRDENKVTLLKKENCQNLINSYKKENQNLLNPELGTEEFVKNVDFTAKEVDFYLDDCDFLVQRLDPTHAPFPPKGGADYHEFLREYLVDKNIKNQNFNYPVDCFLDKELPVKMGLDIEVKSWISFVGDEGLAKKALQARDFSGCDKIVLKPDNSGQSMGVFALEFAENGLDFAGFEEIGLEKLQESQIYLAKSDISEVELQKVIELLLFCQSEKFGGEDLALYNSKIIVQPFIEGVKKGDIRVNVAKVAGKFEVFGVVFRKFASEDGFTTCVTGGMALPVSILGEITESEIADLSAKTKAAVDLLNGDLAQKYARSFELGFDFILKGDGKTVLLNEVNHACPALLPVAELIRSEEDGALDGEFCCEEFEYDGGLALLKNIMLKNR